MGGGARRGAGGAGAGGDRGDQGAGRVPARLPGRRRGRGEPSSGTQAAPIQALCSDGAGSRSGPAAGDTDRGRRGGADLGPRADRAGAAAGRAARRGGRGAGSRGPGRAAAHHAAPRRALSGRAVRRPGHDLGQRLGRADLPGQPGGRGAAGRHRRPLPAPRPGRGAARRRLGGAQRPGRSLHRAAGEGAGARGVAPPRFAARGRCWRWAGSCRTPHAWRWAREAFCSQHVGDLDSEPARAFLGEVVAGLEDFLQARGRGDRGGCPPRLPVHLAGRGAGPHPGWRAAAGAAPRRPRRGGARRARSLPGRGASTWRRSPWTGPDGVPTARPGVASGCAWTGTSSWRRLASLQPLAAGGGRGGGAGAVAGARGGACALEGAAELLAKLPVARHVGPGPPAGGDRAGRRQVASRVGRRPGLRGRSERSWGWRPVNGYEGEAAARAESPRGRGLAGAAVARGDAGRTTGAASVGGVAAGGGGAPAGRGTGRVGGGGVPRHVLRVWRSS